MDVSDVMYNEPQRECLLILHILEIFFYNFEVFCFLCRVVILEESSQGIKSIINLLSWRLEVWIVIGRASFVKVWLIDEVPARLPCHSFALNIIGKGRTLSEGVVFFMLDQIWVLFACL